jgi:hypothetical protein
MQHAVRHYVISERRMFTGSGEQTANVALDQLAQLVEDRSSRFMPTRSA